MFAFLKTFFLSSFHVLMKTFLINTVKQKVHLLTELIRREYVKEKNYPLLYAISVTLHQLFFEFLPAFKIE